MEYLPSHNVVHACVLAAGASTRFGASKLVQQLRGKPLLQHALLAAQDACEGRVTLVVGSDAKAVIAASAGMGDSVIFNGDHQSGLGTSIAAAVRACRDSADAILIMLADQPLVTAAHLNSLINSWSGEDDELVASSFANTIGPPILFPRKAFDALAELRSDNGAKQLLANNTLRIKRIDFPPAGIDVDTPEDLLDLEQG